MKKILLVAIASLLFACGSSGEKKPKDSAANVQKVVATGEIKHITKAEYLKLVWNYEKNPSSFVFEGKLPVIVDFYATWCGPCKRVAPILEKLAKKYAGKIDIYKVDVDEERDLAAAHGIQSIPTMYFYPKTGQPQVIQGALGEDQLEQAIQQILLSKK
jgi:thioredoxin